MKCYSIGCHKTVKFICLCKRILFCPEHISYHMDQYKNHCSEHLNLMLSNSEFEYLKRELLCRMLTIKESKSKITFISKKMINKIEEHTNLLINELNNLNQTYSALLNLQIFSKTLKLDAETVINSNLTIKEFSMDLDNILKENFGLNVISISKKGISLTKEIPIEEKKVRSPAEPRDKKKLNFGFELPSIEKKLNETKKYKSAKEIKERKRNFGLEQPSIDRKSDDGIKLRFGLETRERKRLNTGCEQQVKKKEDEQTFLDKKIKIFKSLNLGSPRQFLENVEKGFNIIKEIKYSNDKKYTFICKVYLGEC